MRKIVVTEFVSLDGVIEAPMWSAPYWNDDIAEFKDVEQRVADTMLLGRVTYEGFAQAWPQSEDDGADYMNNTPKYVVSTTLESADWNNSTIISENVVDEIKKLKAQDGKDILVYGSGNLVQTLIKHDLVDSYRLLVYPVLVGEGVKLFQDGAESTLKLVETQTFGSVMAMVYEPVRE